MDVYKDSLRRCDAFYKSDFYQFLEKTDPNYISCIFENLCEDPDSCDFSLYQQLGDKFKLPAKKYYLLEEIEGTKVRLSADVICGRKQIIDFHHKKYEYWRQDYECVRSNLNLHFLWPKHKAPTINTYRHTKYLDRIDCLLFDLKCYFQEQETPMTPAYQHETTPILLNQFHNDFKYFIDKMQLHAFVNGDYDVLDISKRQTEVIERIYFRQEISTSLANYMRNMLYLNHQGKFK